MSLNYGLLGILQYSDMTGYELAKTFHNSLSYFWQAQTSQIYRELNKMEEQGLLRSHIKLQTDKPNKRIYSITEAGKTEFQNWLHKKMPDKMMPTRSDVLLRLFFSSERTLAENIAALQHIADIYQKQNLELNSIANIMHHYEIYAHSKKDMLFWDFTADFGRAYSKMCIEWAERCIKRLEECDA